MRKFIASMALAGLACLAVNSASYAGAGKTAAQFLMLQYGSRPSALGGAFNARASGPDALFYNTAGLARSGFNEARAAYNVWLEGTGYGYASFLFSGPFGGAGLGARYFNSGLMTKRRRRDEDRGSYSMVSMAFDGGVGLYISSRLRGGMGLTVINEKIDDESMLGFAFSAALQYETFLGDERGEHNIQVGLSLENMGPGAGYHSETFPLPMMIKLGVADTVLEGRLSAEAGIEFIPPEERSEICLGLEFSPVEFIDLRIGYRIPQSGISFPRGFSAGLGFIYGQEKTDYIFDYGLSSMGELGLGHRLGFGLRF